MATPRADVLFSVSLGLLIYAKRAGSDLICVNQNWHISYTKDAQCTQSEIANSEGYEVSNLLPGNRTPTDIEGADLLFRKYPDDFSELGFVSAEQNPGVFGSVLNGGWSSVESQFVWMQANEAHLLLKVRKGFSGTLQLDLGAFLPRPNFTQHLTIYVNNAPAYHATFDSGTQRQMIRIPIEQANLGRLDIRFAAPDVVSPKSLGMSNDPRTLGVSLYGLGLVN